LVFLTVEVFDALVSFSCRVFFSSSVVYCWLPGSCAGDVCRQMWHLNGWRTYDMLNIFILRRIAKSCSENGIESIFFSFHASPFLLLAPQSAKWAIKIIILHYFSLANVFTTSPRNPAKVCNLWWNINMLNTCSNTLMYT